MLYSFKKINIESPFPTTQCGHSSQVEKLFDYHDHLYARVTGLKDENTWIIHYSMDLLAFDLEHRDELEEKLRAYYDTQNLTVITSTTHTHYANSVRDPEYVKYLFDLLYDETIKMEYAEKKDITTSYQVMHSQAVGKSRISGYETGNEYLGLIRFYSHDDNFLTIVYYNCHPTILFANVPYFSAEYPGYVLRRLEETYPNTDFTYLQGAAGDISSRFTRSAQDYDALVELGERLFEDIQSLYGKEAERVPLQLELNKVEVPYEHEFTPIDLSKVRADLSERERQTIKIGQEMRAKLEANNNGIFNTLADHALVVAWRLGSIKLIFYPNEIFSEYMSGLDVSKELLVSYSDGYGPYILPIDFQYITYEMFTDTLTRKTKEKIIETINTI
ncbi:MAG: hypothetical protein IJM15_02385 [Erysipelotrichaceae bacterium]|nr:hypothetical protein [Erysipelotrichaceae bacterium]